MISALLRLVLLCSLLFRFGTSSSSSSSSSSGSTEMPLPSCDSERPNSWASHRTLTIPEGCLTGSPMEVAMANTLCCVYTHVEVVANTNTNTNTNTRRPILETYDGSVTRIGDCGTSTSIEVMEEVMDRICAMSMGSRDCSDQAVCIEDAKRTATTTTTTTTTTSVTVPSLPVDNDTDTDAGNGNGNDANTIIAVDNVKRHKRNKASKKSKRNTWWMYGWMYVCMYSPGRSSTCHTNHTVFVVGTNTKMDSRVFQTS